jgi:hypothetical protein
MEQIAICLATKFEETFGIGYTVVEALKTFIFPVRSPSNLTPIPNFTVTP